MWVRHCMHKLNVSDTWDCVCVCQVGATNISYVVLHEDRPLFSPECCIIGQPFQPPPQVTAATLCDAIVALSDRTSLHLHRTLRI